MEIENKFTARSLGNLLDEVLDRITEENYLLQRGDIEYQEIPEHIFKNLDEEVLEKLLAIDDRLIHLLETYTFNRDPNKLDYLILRDKDTHLEKTKSRICCIEKALREKSTDPRVDFLKLFRRIKRMKYRDELDRSVLNTRYRDVVKFLNFFISHCKSSEDSYLSKELKEQALEILDKVEEHVDLQYKERKGKIEELKTFFS